MESKIVPKDFLKFFQNLEKMPKKLYYKGNLGLLNKKKIAIVGSRKMSIYTKNCVLELATLLKTAGVCVISGGALGVDIVANGAAMPLSIGIFANGLGRVYPKSNERIIKELYTKCLALSEREDEYLPQGYDFLLRNRLIVALSEAVVIAQADLRSGSMQSARLALKMKKPLYVLPQRLKESEGTNWLIKENKAKLITDFRAFVSDFGEIKGQNRDEFLEFCAGGVSLEQALRSFGEKVYEYELEGKIKIDGVFIRVLV